MTLKSASLLALLALLVSHVAYPESLDPQLKARADAYPLSKLDDGTVYLNIEKAARSLLGEVPPKGFATATLTNLVALLTERLPAGAALHLGNIKPLTEDKKLKFDLRRIKDNIVITGNGDIILGGGQKGIHVLCGPGVEIQPAIEGRSGPLENLTMLFGNCLRISGDVNHSAFIAAVNGWGDYAFKAEARIDDTLFLWFSYNWTFKDYNAHLKTPSPDWWKKNCQTYLDLKGGGHNTRLYLMIETNYGNPGTGVWLRNCDGLALYHGATERSSAQGPGCYYLQDCRNVQLGLRRIFPGTRGGGQAAMPTHGITIDGGSGNILHAVSEFANTYEESLVNSDPKLQIWCSSFDYETKGAESPAITRFAYTPLNNMPQGTNVQAAARIAREQAAKWVTARNKKSGWPDTSSNVGKLTDLIEKGRDQWWPINATAEQTFLFNGKDLTRGTDAVKGPLPEPPSIPATDAPRSFRPLYFTQEPDFGKALLDAGADPTGKKPSDDAFAQVMFGLPAAEVARCYAAIVKGQDQDAYNKLYPSIQPPASPSQKSDQKKNKKEKKGILKRPTLEVPPGTFLLTRTLLFGPGSGGMIGAGPSKTILKFAGDMTGIKQFNPCGFYNFAIEGGRVGLAVTGVDHGAPNALLNKSYVAGDNYYNLTFRGQSFAGMHIGNDDPAIMGGAEHDQDKYINLTFVDTGDYGIYFNNDMLDKWLCLNGSFSGQKKAGISIKFNNLIHGGLYNCSFRNIDGPGVDFMGGNPALGFRPYIVMMDQCEFVECGNASQPALDYGYGEVMSISRTTITTRGKPVKGGYVGSAQHVESLAVDVNLVPGAAAVALRGVRNGQTARANGHILENVKANGPLAFINDANAQNEHYRAAMKHHLEGQTSASVNMPAAPGGNDHADPLAGLDWDTNPAAHELAPTNGWTHPFLFRNCSFGAITYAYTLVNADVNHGKALAEIDLSPLASHTR